MAVKTHYIFRFQFFRKNPFCRPPLSRKQPPPKKMFPSTNGSILTYPIRCKGLVFWLSKRLIHKNASKFNLLHPECLRLIHPTCFCTTKLGSVSQGHRFSNRTPSCFLNMDSEGWHFKVNVQWLKHINLVKPPTGVCPLVFGSTEGTLDSVNTGF